MKTKTPWSLFNPESSSLAKAGDGHTCTTRLSRSHGLPQAFLRSLCLYVTGMLISLSAVFAAPPDLTNGEARTDVGDSNLGPTGMRGWIYQEEADTTSSRQILVTEVDAGSPAAGILAANDVILGANGTGS